MTFNRELIEAQLALDLIESAHMPKLAQDALEAGLDGPTIRRLAVLERPTYFEIVDVLPRAMHEMGMVKMAPGAAALRLAANRAKEILDNGEDPLKDASFFEGLCAKAGYPREMKSVVNFTDEAYIASWDRSEDEMREWAIAKLTELVHAREIA